ncbi:MULTISPECIES: hypothetical protein [Actinoplanes]|uniref:hypothetical protein n=1 Tax=Actinoplanes TaxID=1865 RepID=UPI0005F2EB5A|nr:MULTISPECIES: hypothetical protein [Actinoplanes]GLY05128.1 hypothetical protein Acsp01_55070 [Actinoplanes sp. NBRC 101535]
MTGAVTVSAIVGLLSLFAGVALGWYLRRTNDWCPTCGEQLTCGACTVSVDWREHSTSGSGR